jgi:hypothetical protein
VTVTDQVKISFERRVRTVPLSDILPSISAGTAGEAVVWGGSRAEAGMAANPFRAR